MIIGMGDIQEFFCKAMRQSGYSGGSQRVEIPGMPGYKALPFKEGDFSLLDCWCTTSHSNMSAGTTTIWYKDDPVWWMRYNGWYTELGIQFLKLALRQTAESGEWFGGRGPLEFSQGNLVYYNHPNTKNFGAFDGYEYILDRGDKGVPDQLGFHEYSGFLLL